MKVWISFPCLNSVTSSSSPVYPVNIRASIPCQSHSTHHSPGLGRMTGRFQNWRTAPTRAGFLVDQRPEAWVGSISG